VNRKLLLAILAGVVAAGALSTVLFPPEPGGSVSQGSALTGQWVVWLAAVAAFMTVSGLFIWVHVQRRLIARTQFVDSTATPMPMRLGDPN